MQTPNFFAIIPASVRYDKKLKPNAKLLYGELTALANQEGFCWADNNYFSALYEVNHKTISRWISQLENSGYLKIEHFPELGNKRKIFIENLVTKKSLGSDKKITRVVTKKSLGSDKIVTPIYENNTINNTMNNTQEKVCDYLEFFSKNSPSLWEIFQQQFRKRITENDWEDFKQLFQCKAELENLEFSSKNINSRLKAFATNYCLNHKNDKNKNGKPVIELQAAYMKKPLT